MIDRRAAYMLRHAGIALRDTELVRLMGFYLRRRDGQLCVVLRRHLSARQSGECMDVAQRLADDAATSWEAMAAPPG